MKVFKAPEQVDWLASPKSIFTAGSIEMGKAVDWQSELKKRLTNYDITLLNPRRDDWDSSWTQSIKCDYFKEQVEWELDCQEECDYIFMFFSGETQSPITLLELGLFKDKITTVCCEPNFWRRGNIEVTCNWHGIPLYDNFDDAVKDFLPLIDKFKL